MNRNTLSGVLSVLSGKVITMMIGILSTPFLTRWLGQDSFGYYSTLLAAHSVFMIVVSAGISDGVRKYVAEDRDDDEWQGTVIGFYLRNATLFAVAGAVVLAVLTYVGFFTYIYGEELASYFYLLVVLVITSQYWEFARKALMGFGLEKYSESLKIFYSLSFPLVALPLVYAGYGVTGAILGQIAATVLAGIVALLVLHSQKSLRNAFRRPPETFPRREMLAFNSLSIVLIFLLSSLYHVDVLMLQAWVDSAQVGYYKAALIFAEFLWFVPVALQMVFVHSTSELWSQGKTEQVSRLATKAMRYTFLLTAVMVIGIAALAEYVVPIYIGYGTAPVGPLLLLLPGALGFALARPMLAISQGKGTLRYPIAATGGAAVINLVLNLLLIPRYGMHGAAVATSIGYASMAVFHVWSARTIGFDPLADARVSRITLTSLVAAVPIFALTSAIAATAVVVPYVGALSVSVFIVPPVGFAIFFCVAIVFRAIKFVEILQLLVEFPDPIGSRAKVVYRRVQQFDGKGQVERLLRI